MQDSLSVSIVKEFTSAKLGDRRLNGRLLQLSEALAGQPQASIPKATGSWGQACAAYRFLDHTTFTPHDILRPHFLQTRERAATRKRVLAVADTTSLNYGQSPQTQGLGLIGGRADKIFGLMLHSHLRLQTSKITRVYQASKLDACAAKQKRRSEKIGAP